MQSLATRLWAPPALCGAVALALYASTAARLPQLGDGLEFVAAAACGGVAHPPGFPLLTTLLAPLARGEHAYFHSTLACALVGAATAAGAAMVCQRVLAQLEPRPGERARAALALFVGLATAFSQSLWSASTIVEAYGLNAMLMTWALVLLVPARPSVASLAGAGALAGLCLGNHYTGLAVGPLLAARVLLAPCKGRAIAASAAAFLAGASILLLMPLRASAGPPVNWGGADTIEGFLWMLRGGDYGRTQFLQYQPGIPFTAATWLAFAWARVVLLVVTSGTELLGGVATAATPAGLALAIVAGIGLLAVVGMGMKELARRDFPAFLGLALGAVLWLALYLMYNIPDISDYQLALHVLLLPAWCGGLCWLARQASCRLGYNSESTRQWRLLVLAALALLVPLGANWKAADRSNRDIAARWMDRLEQAMPPGALVLTHGDYATYSLWQMQHAEGRRPDLVVVPSNFLRYAWAGSMMPPAQPDPLGRSVQPEPGDFTQFTATDHADMIARNVIDPNIDRGPMMTTSMDPALLDYLQVRYLLQPTAVLITREEAEVLAPDVPILPPPMALSIAPRPARGAPAP